MALIVAGGGEEAHISAFVAVGPWFSAVSITFTATAKTGNWGFELKCGTASGTSRASVDSRDKAWWSYASIPWNVGGGDGAYQLNFYVNASPQRYFGWYYDGANLLLALFSAAGTRLATASTAAAAAAYTPCKWEFDAGQWTMWADYGAGFVEDLTYTEIDENGGAMATIVAQMSVNGSSDEGKIVTGTRVDDCLCWDDDDDHWNSRIPAQDFPRISAAHYPETSDNSISGVEYLDLDEAVPDHAASAGEDKAGYLAVVEDLKAAPEDYTAETIQALMVTHVALWPPSEDTLKKYNIKTGGTEYLDSAERYVQHGNDSGGGSAWVTYGGYYPWTPTLTPENWTEALFNGAEYGFSLIDGKSDQLTVQVIYFGSRTEDWEWTPPAEEAARRIFITSY